MLLARKWNERLTMIRIPFTLAFSHSCLQCVEVITDRDAEVKAAKAQTVRRQIDGALLYGKVLSVL